MILAYIQLLVLDAIVKDQLQKKGFAVQIFLTSCLVMFYFLY